MRVRVVDWAFHGSALVLGFSRRFMWQSVLNEDTLFPESTKNHRIEICQSSTCVCASLL